MISKDKIKWFTLAGIAIAFWSVHAIIIRYLIFDNNIPPHFISFIRFFIWWLVLFIISLFVVKKLYFINFYKKDKIYKNKTFLWSVVFLCLNFIFFHYWLKYTIASDSILLETMSPIVAVILTYLLFPNRIKNIYNIKKLFIAVIIWSVWSSLVISNPVDIINVSDKIFWDILQFLAMFFFAWFLVFNSELKKTTENVNWLLTTANGLLIWALLVSPLLLFSNIDFASFSVNNLILISIISIWSTWILYLCWFLAAKYLSVITLALLFNITWITTIIIENYVYEEYNIISWQLLLWGLLIVIASLYVECLNKKQE